MDSELSFLIELLLNHDIPKATKDLIAKRIKDVEANLTYRQGSSSIPQPIPRALPQAPSTLALMAKHGDIPQVMTMPVEASQPVIEVAQTIATAAAMQSRQEAIAQSLAGTVDKKSGRPRKW